MAYRKEKIEEQIKRIISELLIKEIKDPRIGFATISSVEISKDYNLAKVGISVFGDKKDLRNTLAGLNSAKGFIQFKVGRNLGIRQMPRIAFYLDTSIADGVEMVNLIEQLNQNQHQDQNEEYDTENKNDIKP